MALCRQPEGRMDHHHLPMGVQTEYEGIWDRIAIPNHYIKIFCWYALTLALHVIAAVKTHLTAGLMRGACCSLCCRLPTDSK